MAPVHSKEFVKKVVDYRYKDGLNSTQVVEKLGVEFYKMNHRTMTRNIVIGIWNRNKHRIDENDLIRVKSAAVETAKRINFAQFERKKTKQETFRLKNCLSCRKSVLLEKNLYICEPCKKSDSYKYNATQHTYHTGGA